MKKHFWCMAMFALGCSSTPLDIGSNVGSEDDEITLIWTPDAACRTGKQLPIVGTWIGHLDGLQLPSGSTAVRLVISGANSLRVCGTMILGEEQAPWPPPTNPDVGYPPDVANNAEHAFSSYISVLEGVPLTLVGGRATPPRLRFRASYGQWREWCALQTPYPCEGVAAPEYYCVPARGSGGLAPRVRYTQEGCIADYGGKTIAVDCGKAALCFGGPCTCDAKACSAPPLWGMNYDVLVRGDTIEGDGLRLTKAH
jgi:hypothetical protein